MNFKKLEVYGFKSFADKLVLEFGDGITAIVGPNGCGKSNVADSIRWALGEQSAKTLRGSQMNDVIFNGTEKRRSLSYCEVLLYFDNTEKIFDSSYNEIVISRKLYRDGTSEYSINKQPCRLKDITLLLHSSGLGRDGYSIIGQGKIDEILSAKAEDRRAIFEDAAGIGKYKQVKLENERKLERITEKLVRVSDIVNEIKNQLEPLGKQAETAKKAFMIKDTLRTLDVNCFIYQYDTAGQMRDAIQNRIDGHLQELALKTAESEGLTARYNAALDRVNTIDENIKELNAEHLSLTVNLEKKAGEVRLLKQKLTGLQEQNEILRTQIEKLDKDYIGHNSQISELSKQKTEKIESVSGLRKEVDELSGSFMAVSEILANNESEVVTTHRQIVESMNKLSDIKSRMSTLTAEKASLLDRLEYYKNSLDVIKAVSANEKGNADVLTIELNKNKQKAAQTAQKSDFISGQYNETVLNIRNLAVQIDKASQNFHTLSAKKNMYIDMQKEMSGFQYPVKKLIQDSKLKPELASKIEGIVAGLIKVDFKLETAIEMSLGNAIQNIVTPTEDDAKFLIEYLKKALYGRATFLPLNAVKPRYLEAEFSKYLSYSGCYGVASDLISYDPKYDGIFKGLLGKTVIVDKIDTAVKIAKDSKFGFKIVTLDGDIINPHGAITGGSKKEVSNLLSIEREAEEVGKACEKAEAEVAALNSTRAALVLQQENLMKELRVSNEQKQSLEIVIATQNEKLEKTNQTIEQSRKQSFQLEADSNQVFKRIADIEKEIESVDKLEIEINSRKNAANSFNEQNQKQFDVLRKNRDELLTKLTDAKVKLSAEETELTSIESQIARIKSEIVSILADIDSNKSQIERNNSTIKSIEIMPVEITDKSETEMRERLEVVVEKLNDLDKYKAECQSEYQKLDDARQEMQSVIGQINESKFKEELQLTQVNDKLQYYTDKITEEYELDYNSCQIYRVENFDISQGSTEANKLRKDLIRLGNVNMSAIDDYEKLKERYDNETNEKADLEKSIEDTKLIIKDMTKEMLSRFDKQFEEIRKNFVKCFRALFGGGNADLLLEDNENPLEAGIEIIAEPPGKKLQSISLLSGGERALTAIAILFAILKLRPMPFCVLDEIEAALDDANAERFAKYLHNYSEKTQFIVITHRKPTMELADSLYGVTMEEKGISKIVSVKLSEAVRSSSEAQGAN